MNNLINLFIFIISLLNLIDIVLCDCHTGSFDSSVPTLGITTADVSNAKTDDDDIYARIHYGNGVESTKTWSDWRKLDTSGCTDFGRGSVDYFDDFEDITEKWWAVALYNCGKNAFAVSEITYWNGRSWEDNIIDIFCGNVAGPVGDCYDGETTNENGETCYDNENDPIYEYVWISQADQECHGMSVSTTGTLTDDITPVGKIYTSSQAYFPDCSGEYGGYSDNNYLIKEEEMYSTTNILNSMNILFGVISILIITNCFLICVMIKNNKNKNTKYHKVHVESE